MERQTQLLCCNVIGTERLKPVMCGKMARQRAWGALHWEGSLHSHPFVHWVETKKACMTKDLFGSWLLAWLAACLLEWLPASLLEWHCASLAGPLAAWLANWLSAYVLACLPDCVLA